MRHEGFEEFYDAVFGRLVGQLYLVTGDLHDAEDAVQEALTRAAARWTSIRDYAVPEAWVRRVAMNLASDGFRRARRWLAVAVRLRPDVEADTVRVLDGLAVADALRALPIAQRKVVVLRHLLDLPVERVAAELGVPVGTVKSRLARARGVMAAHLGSQEERRGDRGGCTQPWMTCGVPSPSWPTGRPSSREHQARRSPCAGSEPVTGG